MKAKLVLLSVSLMLFLMALTPIVAQEIETPLEINPEGLKEALKELEETGTETVPVPIPYMRNALWYYEHYFIIRDLNYEYEKYIVELETDFADCAEDVRDLRQENSSMEKWLMGTGSYGIIATFIIVLIIAI